MEGTKTERGKHRQQIRDESEITGRETGIHGGEQAEHKLNETQHEEEGRESGHETEKEQRNRQI